MDLSVIIPTKGRNDLVNSAIGALANLKFDHSKLEVLVVDNNDQQETSAELKQMCDCFPPYVRYLREPSPGLSAARHFGAKEAKADILAFIDDDSMVSPNWARAICNAFADARIGITGGPSIPTFPCTVPAWLWGFFRKSPYGGWHCGWLSLLDIGHDVQNIDPVWVWGLNFCIRKQYLRELGGFNPDLVARHFQRWQGDGETGLALKARDHQLRADYVHEAVVHHVLGAERLTVEYFEQRAFYQGVCDSFTSIRSGSDPANGEQGPRDTPPRPVGGDLFAESYETQLRTVKAYNKGWLFHQREVYSDLRLLGWVRRPDFWDADIREEAALQVQLHAE